MVYIVSSEERVSSGEEGDTENIDYQEILKGKTFKIYCYLLISGQAGIREIQRELGFSSPNIVTHHLKKLLENNLVHQNTAHGKYEVKREIKTGVMSLYTRFGRFLIPQNAFLLAFFLTMTISYILFIIVPRGSLIPADGFFMTLSLAGIIFFIFQMEKIWRMKPL